MFHKNPTQAERRVMGSSARGATTPAPSFSSRPPRNEKGATGSGGRGLRPNAVQRAVVHSGNRPCARIRFRPSDAVVPIAQQIRGGAGLAVGGSCCEGKNREEPERWRAWTIRAASGPRTASAKSRARWGNDSSPQFEHAAAAPPRWYDPTDVPFIFVSFIGHFSLIVIFL